ncbi:MAG: DUF4136 domain-containing protein [Parasphingorhabdus sp.]|nr:DUF4136 domain-containing protein [Parasphingorhabdus sp.]
MLNISHFSRVSRRTAQALIPAALLLLAGCATPFRADVARFQALPPAQGQSFAVLADKPDLAGGLEFQQYANLVKQKLIALGYQEAVDPAKAELLVRMDYSIDKGRDKVVADYDPFGFDPYWGRPYFGRLGYFGHGYGARGYRFGYYDPFLYGGYGFSGYGDVRSFTVYTSALDLKIDRGTNQERVFEGKAEAQSRSKNLTYLVPNLIEAMFTGFPGNSGETVRISVAPEKPGKKN